MKDVVIFDDFFFLADGGSLGSKYRVLRPLGMNTEGLKRKSARTATQPRGGYSGVSILRLSDAAIVFCVVDKASWDASIGHQLRWVGEHTCVMSHYSTWLNFDAVMMFCQFFFSIT